MTSVADVALAAYEAEREAEAQRRAENARRRAEEDAAKDAATMAWVNDHPWLRRYLPDAKWVLIERRFPQETAVIRPMDDPDDLMIIVTRTHEGHVQLAQPGSDGTRARPWLVGATMCRDLGALGEAINDRRRKAQREDQP